MQLSLNQLLTLINRVEGELALAFSDFQKGAFKSYKKTNLMPDKELVLEEVTLEEHEAALARVTELQSLVESLRETRRVNNREVTVTYNDRGEEKTLSIADAIEEAKFIQRLMINYNHLSRKQKLNIFTSQSENNVTEYTHDIEGYKEVVKELQKTKDSISQAISKANVEVVIEVEDVSEFL